MGIAGLPGPPQRTLGERRNVPMGLLHGIAQVLRHGQRCPHRLRRGDRQLRRSQPGTVEPFGQVNHGGIAAGPDLLDNATGPLFDDGIKQTGGRGAGLQQVGKAGIGETDDAHRGSG